MATKLEDYLYTALGGIRPSVCLRITIEVGTNNEKMLNDEFYIGLRQNRASGQEYTELMNELMSAVKQNYAENVLIQFEDFANHNAFDLLAKYSATHLVFNDDIQGTTSVLGNFIHYMATFVSGFIVGFTAIWQLALVTLAVVPHIAIIGGIHTTTLSKLSSKSQSTIDESNERTHTF